MSTKPDMSPECRLLQSVVLNFHAIRQAEALGLRENSLTRPLAQKATNHYESVLAHVCPNPTKEHRYAIHALAFAVGVFEAMAHGLAKYELADGVIVLTETVNTAERQLAALPKLPGADEFLEVLRSVAKSVLVQGMDYYDQHLRLLSRY